MKVFATLNYTDHFLNALLSVLFRENVKSQYIGGFY